MQISQEFKKSRWKLGLVIPISLGAIALLNLIMSLIFYLNSQAVVKTMNWVNHTNEVKMRIRSLEKFLVDAETGQRGFIFTGEEEFLESYTDGLKNQESVKIELKNLISDNPEQLQRLAQIELLIKDKFDELAMTINLKRSGKEQELRNLVLSDKGKK